MMAVMARGTHNSPLVRITWSDAVSGNTRSTFKQEEPLELRCGVTFEPNFWTSFESSSYFFTLRVFRNGSIHKVHQFSGDTRTLPGAPGAQLWVGGHFGRAIQATGSGPVRFTGEMFFSRSGGVSNGTSQWAMTPNDHGLFVEFLEFGETGMETTRFVGGAGTPAGTPTS
jgi:hypothetical protein